MRVFSDDRLDLPPRLGRWYTSYLAVRWTVKALPIGIVVLLWELASGTIVSSQILPPFSVTASEIVALGTSSELHTNLLHTLFRGLAGLAIAIAIAVPVGLAMSQSERIADNLDPVISLTYPVPKSPMIPLVVFWLGMGHLSRIALAMIGSILPILISTYNGAATVRREYVWVARSLGIGRVKETYTVTLPAALPTVMTGIRIGMIFSFIIVIASEMIMANTGLGVLVIQAGQYGFYDRVFATVFWIAVLVAGLDRGYLLLSARILRWSDQDVSAI